MLGFTTVEQFSFDMAPLIEEARHTGELDLSRYDDIDAVSDLPAAVFLEEFLARYPGLQVILTIRDEAPWLRSMEQHIARLPIQSPWDFHLHRYADVVWLNRLLAFGTTDYHRLLMAKRCREHNDRIRQITPPGQLLELDVTNGMDPWPALCDFLGRCRRGPFRG